MSIKTFFNRIFQLEEINGDGVCPTYLYRWTLLSLPWCKVYLHRFVGDDWSKDFHDHPKRFVTIGLKGRYVEATPQVSRTVRPWGFWHEGGWIPWREYVHSDRAEKMKSCS